MIGGTPVSVDNRYVVPYNPFLCLLLNAHINVEYCASLKCIQYLFKYQLKGTDQATISIENVDVNNNEVTAFETKRYVSSMEAAWRIFNYEICKVKPAVVRLPVHLPDQQTITYIPNNAQDAAEALIRGEKTKLTEYFTANAEHPHAREIFYIDFPEHFTWHQGSKKWNP